MCKVHLWCHVIHLGADVFLNKGIFLSQRGKEGDLMRSLSPKVKDLPLAVTSALVVESAARFRDNTVLQLLDPQSAMNHLLSYGT